MKNLTILLTLLILGTTSFAQDAGKYNFKFTSNSGTQHSLLKGKSESKPKAAINFSFDGKILKAVYSTGENLFTHFISRVVETTVEKDGDAAHWALEYTGGDGLMHYLFYTNENGPKLWVPHYAKNGLLDYYIVYN